VHANEFSVEKEIPEEIDPRFANKEYKFRATYIAQSPQQYRLL